MRKFSLLIFILAGGMEACAHLGGRPSQPAAQVTPPAVERVTPIPAPPPSSTPASPPAAPIEHAAPVESQPSAPAGPKPSVSGIKPTRSAATEKPSSAKSAKDKPPAAAGSASTPVPSLPSAANPPKPQLDFKAMEQRLRDTSAIGVFTKLSIKNRVDDLLKAFQVYHAGRTPPTLDELHQRFDGLLLKVVTLVQNDDATLASSISASRNAIWDRLSNRESFQALTNT